MVDKKEIPEVTASIKATKAEVELVCNALHQTINTPFPATSTDPNWKAPYMKLLNDYRAIKNKIIDYEQKHASPGQD